MSFLGMCVIVRCYCNKMPDPMSFLDCFLLLYQHHSPQQTLGGRGILLPCRLQSIIKGSKGRNSRQGLKQRP